MTGSAPLIPRRPSLRLRRFGIASLLAATMPFGVAVAQVTEPTSPSAASAAAANEQTPKRPMSSLTNSSDAQRSMDLNNNEQPGGKVVPQVRIPLGRKAGPPVLERRRSGATAASASAGVIDDAAARCESETDKQVRADCRARSTRQ